jgi:methionyl-tRNA formyltransferase
MKIILLANHAGILPVMDMFNTQGWLQAVISTDKLASHNLQIEDYCKIKGITHLKVNKEQLVTTVAQLFLDLQPDLAIMYGFTYRIPTVIYTIPRLGFYNIHFSLLPAYRGSDPIFWQLKNGEETGGITIHKVDKNFDTGDTVMQQEIAFMRGENWGICNSRYTQVAFDMIMKLTAMLKSEGEIAVIKNEGKPGYYPVPSARDLTVQWEMHSSEEIENLVNAANPGANGAITLFRGAPAALLEVSPVDGMGAEGVPGGVVIHADGSGVYVQCMDRKILRINILKLNEGFFTGFKLAAMGIQTGDRFETLPVAMIMATN